MTISQCFLYDSWLENVEPSKNLETWLRYIIHTDRGKMFTPLPWESLIYWMGSSGSIICRPESRPVCSRTEVSGTTKVHQCDDRLPYYFSFQVSGSWHPQIPSRPLFSFYVNVTFRLIFQCSHIRLTKPQLLPNKIRFLRNFCLTFVLYLSSILIKWRN